MHSRFSSHFLPALAAHPERAAQFTRISAIRHGETDWNVATRIQGSIDIALNSRGLAQAQCAALALQSAGEVQALDRVDAVYASDLSRAFETGRCIAQTLNVPISAECGLRERCYGEFEGHVWSEIADKWPDKAQAWRARVPEFAPEGGESLLAFQTRTEESFARLAAQHQGQHIVCVVHGGVLDMLYRLATGCSLTAPRTWHLGNAAINRLLWTPQALSSGLSLLDWGDVEHLQGLSLDESNA